MEPEVTIIIAPREHFSCAERSLESIYEHTNYPFKLVYVDGNSPPRVKHYLRTEAERRGFQLIRTEHYLSPNEARNIGLRHVKSKYVVFMDNDAVPTPGWLEKLVQCAEETAAWVVGPLYLIGELEQQTIHMAGGTVHTEQKRGKRVLRDKHHHLRTRLSDLSAPLKRERCDFVEFHCMLVRADVFTRLGPLDEGLLSLNEHLDLCLNVGKAGGTVYLEPEAVVTHITPSPVVWSDLPYFMLRWSEAWNLASLNHFDDKWGVELDQGKVRWLRHRRQMFLQPVQGVTKRVFGRYSDKADQLLLFPMENFLNRILIRDTDRVARRKY
jgi:GT2 family glycosyltransferase